MYQPHLSGGMLCLIGIVLMGVGLTIIGYGEEMYAKGKMGRLTYVVNYAVGATFTIVPLFKLFFVFLLG